MESRDAVKRVFLSALRDVAPACLVKNYAGKIRSYYEMKNFRKLVVVGFGKASYQMAESAEACLGSSLISEGVIVTKYGHALNQLPYEGARSSAGLEKIRVYEAGHPVPDEKGAAAAEEIIACLKGAGEDTLVLCLVSGGGSALFVSPCDGISLMEKQTVTDLLLKAGADISELNAVRKHLSKVKGGRLAEFAYPAEVISLMISDVIGDKLDVIASGPTAPDTSTFQDALDVIYKYDLARTAPARVIDILKKGAGGEIPDTPKKDSTVFSKVQNIIIGSNSIAVEAARREAESIGYQSEIISTGIKGEAREIGGWLAEKAMDARLKYPAGRRLLVSGGETTVSVKGKGKGGRNTELALSFAMAIEGLEGITMLSAGTDGTDGPTDAAGAVVDGQTIKNAKRLGLDPMAYLENNDSYNFFREIDSLLITGPTGTNVMDIQIMAVE